MKVVKNIVEVVETIRFHSMLAVILFVGAFLSFLYWPIHFLLLLFFSGTLGGTISTYIRVKSLPLMDQEKPTIKKLAIIQIYITPIVAGIFGFILYLLFVSGILAGALFPEFVGLEANFETAQSMFDLVTTKTNLDAMKALVWAFIAGFSERMVPNILDKIVKEAENK